MSTVPEISEVKEEEVDEITPTPSFENGQSPDENEASKQDSSLSNQYPINKSPQNVSPKQDSTTPNPQNRVLNQEKDQNSHKISACLPLFLKSKPKKSHIKEPDEVQVQGTAVAAAATSTYSSKEEIFKSIAADIKYIIDECQKLDRYKESLQSQVTELSDRLELLKKEGSDKEFQNLQKEVTKLKFQIPSKHKSDVEEKDSHKFQQHTKSKPKTIPEKVMQQMPQLYNNNLFENCPEYKDLVALFDSFRVELKLCLLCFAVFPQNAIIKKRLMVYWWMAEGFVEEELAGYYFENLTKMGFIEPVNKKRSLSIGSYKVQPFVRLVLVMLAEKARFFEFNEVGEPNQIFSRTFSSCLVGKGLIDYGDLRAGKVKLKDLDKLHSVINVNEPILEFKKDWLLNMKNVVVLYLGRWTVSATHHIEIEDDEEKDFLDGLKNMAHLRFFSLQGVSRIMELPDAVLNLSSLTMLDLRACHNLESIPDGIGLLKNLTHLDMSECYLLEHMPKELSLLAELRVLKGFVIGADQSKHFCSLEDLSKLEKLIKLSIYTGLQEFPTDQHIIALQRFKELRKLTIAWGAGTLQDKGQRNDQVKNKQGSDHALSESRSIPESPKHDHGKVKKDNTKEKIGAETSPTSEVLKPKKKFTIADKTEGSAAPKTQDGSEKPKVKSFVKVPTFSKKPTFKAQIQRLERLEKLDLKSFPTATTPKWLTPSNLPSLEKLYIRGGKFSDLGQYQDLNNQDEREEGRDKKPKWNIKILRLKYLSEIEMDWRELQELFPEMIYMEKVSCPKLSFFPCDGYGVWIHKEKFAWTIRHPTHNRNDPIARAELYQLSQVKHA